MKIGIITMHRVLNCGSALQAYALQYVLQKKGHDVELIDYVYPNEYHKSFYTVSDNRLLTKILKMIRYPIQTCKRIYYNKIRHKDFIKFYNKYYNLSDIQYRTRESLKNNPPQYDVYISGSDQIWNPRYVHADTSYMLSFVHNVNKIAYSSSFSVNLIPDEYKDTYAKALIEYKHIALREKSGCDIIKSLINKSATYVLDPTLLLTPEQWRPIAEESSIHIDGPYLLVYVLGYSWNPYPYVVDLLKKIQIQTQLKIVFLRFDLSELENFRGLNYKVIYRINPAIFISLFSNATLVLTDSFHGTAFSANFNIPFYSLIPESIDGDNRIFNFLTEIDATERAIKLNSSNPDLIINEDFTKINANLNKLRQESLSYLFTSLND